jgi:RNA polymerase sigma-B factor
MGTQDERAQSADRLWSAFISDPTPQRREQLIDFYTPLALGVLHRLVSRWDEDLQQVALLGLVNAVDRFDPNRGYQFTSFAVPTITGEIKRCLRDHSRLVRCPRSILDLRAAVSAKERDLTMQSGQVPGLAEVAAALGLELDDVVDAMATEDMFYPRSLDGIMESIEHGQSPALEEHLGVEDPALVRVEDRIAWRQELEGLEPRYKEVIQLRYFGSLSQVEVARRLGVSQMQVSRLERRALAQLRGLLTVC